MKLGEAHQVTGLVYEIEDTFEGYDKPVIVDVTYSGGEDNEFVFASAQIDPEFNPNLSEELIEEFNDILECEREQDYVSELEKFYAGTDIKFITEQ